jgi:hypothetical protein
MQAMAGLVRRKKLQRPVFWATGRLRPDPDVDGWELKRADDVGSGAVELVGPERALQIFGVKLVGVTAETGRKILLSVLAVLAIALQRVVTAFAAYFVILRGRLFRVGDRLVMGGVCGDVIALGFIRTTIMELGEPPRAERRTCRVGRGSAVHGAHRDRNERPDL